MTGIEEVKTNLRKKLDGMITGVAAPDELK
jgi:hypothetical protein